jgi:hypothetical protein
MVTFADAKRHIRFVDDDDGADYSLSVEGVARVKIETGSEISERTSLAMMMHRRDMIRLAWKRALSASTPERREHWRRFARRLEDELDKRLRGGDDDIAAAATR